MPQQEDVAVGDRLRAQRRRAGRAAPALRRKSTASQRAAFGEVRLGEPQRLRGGSSRSTRCRRASGSGIFDFADLATSPAP